MHIWQKKTTKLSCMTALRNKTVAHTFLQSFKHTLTVSVNKDGRDPGNLLRWECDVTLLLSIHHYTSPIMHLICPNPPPPQILHIYSRIISRNKREKPGNEIGERGELTVRKVEGHAALAGRSRSYFPLMPRLLEKVQQTVVRRAHHVCLFVNW